jgi:MoaA/NifB/PqqE/SkfB family radical SAM enzyme
MTLRSIKEILNQARDLGTVEWIYFEGGEPFLYYAVLLEGVRMARGLGFHVGIVSNGYWATEPEDALEWLRPLAGLIESLSVSSDLFHGDETTSTEMHRACAAAEGLGIPTNLIRIAQPEAMNTASDEDNLPAGVYPVMYRGRAAELLVPRASRRPWEQFAECPHEDLREPGRVHVDPFGNVHLCQGISLGNLFERPLARICETYDPDAHPVVGPMLAGGPAELVRAYGLAHEDGYADACHLCYECRRALRERLPEVLKPDGMYGLPSK